MVTLTRYTAEHFDPVPGSHTGEQAGGYENFIVVTCEHGARVEAHDEGHAHCLARDTPSFCPECRASYQVLHRSFDREPHDARDLEHWRLKPEDAGRVW